jgi:uncharacterized protein YndB with AHSA1/START domain
VYRALLDPSMVAKWRVPTGMTSVVHEFDAREGGSFRISLTYDMPDRIGKTAAQTDTYHGHFARLVPDEQVVEVLEFETADPALRGAMTMTTTLADADGGTDVLVAYEGLPRGLSVADNELGTRIALDNLAALLERERPEGTQTLKEQPPRCASHPPAHLERVQRVRVAASRHVAGAQTDGTLKLGQDVLVNLRPDEGYLRSGTNGGSRSGLCCWH